MEVRGGTEWVGTEPVDTLYHDSVPCGIYSLGSRVGEDGRERERPSRYTCTEHTARDPFQATPWGARTGHPNQRAYKCLIQESDNSGADRKKYENTFLSVRLYRANAKHTKLQTYDSNKTLWLNWSYSPRMKPWRLRKGLYGLGTVKYSVNGTFEFMVFQTTITADVIYNTDA